jgi:hypothetical protein
MTTLATSPVPEVVPPGQRRRRLFRPSLYLLRLLSSGHALLALSQALSIGQYFGGNYPMLRVHAVTGGILILAAAALALVAVLYAVAGGRVWVAVVCPLCYLAEGLQIGMGYDRSLAVHVPLGVIIVAAALLVAGWSWSRSAGRAR